MKIKSLLWSCTILLFFAACSTDDDFFDQVEFDDISFPRYYTDKWISYNENEDVPSTATEMFRQKLGLGEYDDYVCYMTDEVLFFHVERYMQTYKGIPVYDFIFIVRFKNDRIEDANGNYIKIENLNTEPAVNEMQAKRICARFMKTEEALLQSGIDHVFNMSLMIAEFPVSKDSDQWMPRLVYAFNNGVFGVIIDANTGNILRTKSNYIIIN